MKLPSVKKMKQGAKTKQAEREKEEREKEKAITNKRESFRKSEEERIASLILENIGTWIADAANDGEDMFSLYAAYGHRKEGYDNPDTPYPNPDRIADIVNRKIEKSGYYFCFFTKIEPDRMSYSGYERIQEYRCSWRS